MRCSIFELVIYEEKDEKTLKAYAINSIFLNLIKSFEGFAKPSRSLWKIFTFLQSQFRLSHFVHATFEKSLFLPWPVLVLVLVLLLVIDAAHGRSGGVAGQRLSRLRVRVRRTVRDAIEIRSPHWRCRTTSHQNILLTILIFRNFSFLFAIYLYFFIHRGLKNKIGKCCFLSKVLKRL